jgi:hypothetical protein
LDNPVKWTREPVDEDEAQKALAGVRQAVFSTLHDVARNRLIDDKRLQWSVAFDLRGPGSTFERAAKIGGIFDDAVPMLGAAMRPNTIAFLNAVRGLVADAIRESGGSLEVSSAQAGTGNS